MKKSISYSQNFLTSKSLVAGLIDKSSITKGDLVYEIGAGEGIITEELAKRCRKVIAIEIDPRLHKNLTQKFANIPNIEVHQGNFLAYNLPQTDYKVFSNVPFNITAEVIRKLTNTSIVPKDTYLIVQNDAAKKYLGQPYAKETQFSILLKPRFELSIVHQFRKTDFRPVPQVETVLLRLKLRDKPLLDTPYPYRDFIVYAFSQWKPTLQEGLKAIFTREQFVRLSKDLSFPLRSIPTQLNFDQWLGLYRYFLTGVNSNKKQNIVGAYDKALKQQAGLQKIHRTRVDRDWKTARGN